MKASVERKALISALEKCALASSDDGHASAGKTLLTSVSPQDADSALQLYANDLALSVDVAIPAEVEVAASVGIGTAHLTSVVKAMPDGQIALVLDGTRLAVSGANRRKTTIPTLDAAIFPTPPEPPEDSPSCEIPTDILTGLIGRVRYAVAPKGHDRVHLQAVRLEVGGGEAIAVATDSYRLAKAARPVDGALTFSASLPGLLVKAIDKICPGEDGVKLITTDAAIFVETEDVLVGSLLPRQDFPQWENMLGQLQAVEGGSVKRDGLMEALKGIAAARISDGFVQLSTKDPFEWLDVALVKDDGAAEDHVALLDGCREFDNGFTLSHLLDAVRSAGEDIQLSIVDATAGQYSAIMFASGDEYLAWVAPRFQK